MLPNGVIVLETAAGPPPFSVVALFNAVHRAKFGDTYLAVRYLKQAREVAAMEQLRQRRRDFKRGSPASLRGGGVNRFI